MPVIPNPILRRQRWVDLHEFEASMIYRVSFRTAQRNPVLKSQTKPNKNGKQNKTKTFVTGTAFFF